MLREFPTANLGDRIFPLGPQLPGRRLPVVLSSRATMNTLQHGCPHCGHSEEDLWECLGEAEIHEIRCEACGGSYLLFFATCDACGHETILTTKSRPSRDVISNLFCSVCGAGLDTNESAAPAFEGPRTV